MGTEAKALGRSNLSLVLWNHQEDSEPRHRITHNHYLAPEAVISLSYLLQNQLQVETYVTTVQKTVSTLENLLDQERHQHLTGGTEN